MLRTASAEISGEESHERSDGRRRSRQHGSSISGPQASAWHPEVWLEHPSRHSSTRSIPGSVWGVRFQGVDIPDGYGDS